MFTNQQAVQVTDRSAAKRSLLAVGEKEEAVGEKAEDRQNALLVVNQFITVKAVFN
tara:strand:- start:331 stop:498 length:168 start_codon:yes stop_codon:yes gene_type:complete